MITIILYYHDCSFMYEDVINDSIFQDHGLSFRHYNTDGTIHKVRTNLPYIITHKDYKP